MFQKSRSRNLVTCLLLLSLTLQLALQYSTLLGLASTKASTCESLAKECEAEGKEASSNEIDQFCLLACGWFRESNVSFPIDLRIKNQVRCLACLNVYLRGPPAVVLVR